ncbi:MAG TPA: transcriptional regulator [Eubacterium sp.]|nr:transcriptional regulator [Eubacterium sp.]
MVFSSIPFLFYFLPLFLMIYFIVPKKCKNAVLLIFSLIFYGWGEPVYISLLIISSVIDFINGLMIEKFKGKRSKQRIFLVVSVVMNVSLLAIFKYADLFIGTFNNITGSEVTLTNLALPIGISFFTFQTMSYSIDVYLGNINTEHNFLNYMTYVSMFPQLIAGPIVRYAQVSIELKSRKVTRDKFVSGFIRFGMGLFKKVLIANQIGMLWDDSLARVSDLSMLGAWLGIVAFALQIYFDFSGYSDMAIGMGLMIGFKYPENFNYPYIASSITDFWRRWHMTLSEWFKLYVYIPLGGNRCGKARAIFNLMVVWTLTGFWHGASWNFMLWGFYFAVLLVLEKYVLANVIKKIPKIFMHFITIILILISWVLFAVEDFDKMITYFKHMFNPAYGLTDNFFKYNIRNYMTVIIIGMILSTPIYRLFRDKVKGLRIVKGLVFITLFIVTISFMVRNTYNPFLYFRF